MLITFTYKFIIIMLICYVTIKLLRQTYLLISSIVVYTELQQTHIKWLGHIVSLNHMIYIHVAENTHFWHAHQTRENISQTPLHTVSWKHVVQPWNLSKTLGFDTEFELAQNLLSPAIWLDSVVTVDWLIGLWAPLTAFDWFDVSKSIRFVLAGFWNTTMNYEWIK